MEDKIKVLETKLKLAQDIIRYNDSLLYNLREIANELSLTYQQVADISVGRYKKFNKSSFKYQPQVSIQKISINV